MNFESLPFDAETMLKGLRPWVECESPTWDAAAVNRVMDLAAYDLAVCGARLERIPGRLGLGDCIRAAFPHPRAGEPGILVLGHLDTVHPVGTLDLLPWRRDGDLCYGPGICDMKAGNYLSLEAMRLLDRAGITTPLPVTFLFTSDEEIGSPSSQPLIEREAARQKYVLVPEPARRDGGVVTGRYAIARFNLKATGRPSHAGGYLSEGQSAINEMAVRILEIEKMSSDDCTFSVGVINAGQWVNCVSSLCCAEVLSMAKRQEDLDRGVQRMLDMTYRSDGRTFTVTRGVTRPVWEPDARTMAVYEQASTIARSLGFAIPHQSSGGGSDGNFTGAMGIPTLDGLGAEGDHYHTLKEHIKVDSLVRRGRLMAGLLTTLE